MKAHDFKLNKLPLFAIKSVNINVSLSAALKLALVPASHYYGDVNVSYSNECAKFHEDRKRFRWGHMTSNLTRSLFFDRKPVNINALRSADPKLALVPASHY